MSSLRHFLFVPTVALGLLALAGCYQPPLPVPPVNNCQMQFIPSKAAVVVPDRLTLTLYRISSGGNNCRLPKSVVFSVNGITLSEDTTEPFVFVWEVKPGEPTVPTIGSRDVELKAVASYGEGAANTVNFGPAIVRLQVLAPESLSVQPSSNSLGVQP
jgi:hypothetical protein